MPRDGRGADVVGEQVRGGRPAVLEHLPQHGHHGGAPQDHGGALGPVAGPLVEAQGRHDGERVVDDDQFHGQRRGRPDLAAVVGVSPQVCPDIRHGCCRGEVDRTLPDSAVEEFAVAVVGLEQGDLPRHSGVHREDLGRGGTGPLVEDRRDLRGLGGDLDPSLRQVPHVHWLKFAGHLAERRVGVRDRPDQFLGAPPAALDELGHRRRGGVHRPAATGGGERGGEAEGREGAEGVVEFGA
ncbi:hypothetical protein [Actinacidiphila sp. bgisy167]|uniref:hypothetical protein n=1 Tax=Actinacidiphila sp. bgisy167 TaxID=3413797 RepID=UPI003D729637